MSDLFEMVVHLKRHNLKTVSLTTILRSLLNLKTERPHITVQIFTKECFPCLQTVASNFQRMDKIFLKRFPGTNVTFSEHKCFFCFTFFSGRNRNERYLSQGCLKKKKSLTIQSASLNSCIYEKLPTKIQYFYSKM